MMRTFVAGLIFLLVSGFFIWQAMTLGGPSSPTQTTLAAAKFAFEEDRFTENLTQLRSALTVADPDGSRRPKSWAALNQLTKNRDDAVASGQNPSNLPVIRSAYKDVIVACAVEETAELSIKAKRSEQLVLLAVVAVSAMAALAFGWMFWSERRLAGELAKEYAQIHQRKSESAPSTKPVEVKPFPLLQQIQLLISDYRDTHYKLSLLKDKQLRMSLEMRDKIKRQATPTDHDPQPPDSPPPGGPLKTTETKTDPVVKSILAPSATDYPKFTFENDSRGKGQEATLSKTASTDIHQTNGILETLNSQAGLHKLSYVQIVTIQMEDLDVMYHLYSEKTEEVVRCVVEHIAKGLLEHNVEPKELAYNNDVVYWALAEETDQSVIEAFVIDCYRSTPIFFQGKSVNQPQLSIFLNQSEANLKRALAS